MTDIENVDGVDPPPQPRVELAGILQTLREVEVSLEKRARRAGALIMIVWGFTAGTIFALYQWSIVDPDPLVGLLGERGVDWLWAGPTALGYVLTLLTGVRLGRMDAKEGSASLRNLLVTLVVPLAIIVAIVTTGFGWQLIPAMMVAFLGYTWVGWKRPGAAPADRALGAACFAAGAVLLVPALWPWASGIAALWYLLFLALPGVLRYHHR